MFGAYRITFSLARLAKPSCFMFLLEKRDVCVFFIFVLFMRPILAACYLGFEIAMQMHTHHQFLRKFNVLYCDIYWMHMQTSLFARFWNQNQCWLFQKATIVSTCQIESIMLWAFSTDSLIAHIFMHRIVWQWPYVFIFVLFFAVLFEWIRLLMNHYSKTISPFNTIFNDFIAHILLTILIYTIFSMIYLSSKIVIFSIYQIEWILPLRILKIIKWKQ